MSSGPDYLSISIPREALADEKQRLRAHVRGVLGKLSLPERARKSALIRDVVANHPRYLEAARVFLYRALPDEPDLRELEADSRPVFFPVIERPTHERTNHPLPASMMRFFPAGNEPFRTGAFGIEEPAQTSPPVIPTAADVLLVPGRAFTKGGLRLGRGAGFYDRYLSNLEPEDFPTLIGIAFAEQLFPSLPAGSSDFPMHLVITDASAGGHARCRQHISTEPHQESGEQ